MKAAVSIRTFDAEQGRAAGQQDPSVPSGRSRHGMGPEEMNLLVGNKSNTVNLALWSRAPAVTQADGPVLEQQRIKSTTILGRRFPPASPYLQSLILENVLWILFK